MGILSLAGKVMDRLFCCQIATRRLVKGGIYKAISGNSEYTTIADCHPKVMKEPDTFPNWMLENIGTWLPKDRATEISRILGIDG